MLINPDLVKAINEEKEYQLAVFHLERQLGQARALRTQHMAHLAEQGIQLVATWAVSTWQRIGWTSRTLNQQADVPALRKSC